MQLIKTNSCLTSAARAGLQEHQERADVEQPTSVLLCYAMAFTLAYALLNSGMQEDQERADLEERLAHMVATTAWLNPQPNDDLSDAQLAAMAAPPAYGEDSTEAPAAAARSQQVGGVGWVHAPALHRTQDVLHKGALAGPACRQLASHRAPAQPDVCACAWIERKVTCPASLPACPFSRLSCCHRCHGRSMPAQPPSLRRLANRRLWQITVWCSTQPPSRASRSH